MIKTSIVVINLIVSSKESFRNKFYCFKTIEINIWHWNAAVQLYWDMRTCTASLYGRKLCLHSFAIFDLLKNTHTVHVWIFVTIACSFGWRKEVKFRNWNFYLPQNYGKRNDTIVFLGMTKLLVILHLINTLWNKLSIRRLWYYFRTFIPKNI